MAELYYDDAADLSVIQGRPVAVLGYGTDAFPGFYIADSGFPAPFRVDTPAEVTAIAHARDALGIEAAVLVARPVPVEHQLDADLHAQVLADALAAVPAWFEAFPQSLSSRGALRKVGSLRSLPPAGAHTGWHSSPG